MRFPNVHDADYCYGDPLAALEKKRAEASGKRMTRRELSSIGNRPVPELPRAVETPKKHKPLEEFLAEESQPKRWSAARKAAESLFEMPCTSV
jgi:hypothetical protein